MRVKKKKMKTTMRLAMTVMNQKRAVMRKLMT